MSEDYSFNCKIIYCNIVLFVGDCITNYNLMHRNAYHNNSEKSRILDTIVFPLSYMCNKNYR